MMLVTVDETQQQQRFDVLRVDFSPEAMVTEHPVELGAEVSDHVQVRPLRFAVEAFVTASPLSPAPAPFAVEEAIRFLEGATGKLLTVTIDGEGTFSSCLLEGWPHSRTAQEGRPFTLRFRQVRIAGAVTVTIPAPAFVGAMAAAHNGTVAALQKPVLIGVAAAAGSPPAGPTSAAKAFKDAGVGFVKALFGGGG